MGLPCEVCPGPCEIDGVVTAPKVCCEFHDRGGALCAPDDRGGYCCDACPTLGSSVVDHG